MKSSNTIKILVLCFSAILGAILVWRMSDGMQPEPDEAVEQTEPQDDQRNRDESIMLGPKSPGGINMGLGTGGKAAKRKPLLPGSKSSTAGLRSGDLESTKESVDDILKKKEKEQKKKPRPLLPSSKYVPYSSE